MAQPDPRRVNIGRRTFGIGVAAASLATALGTASPASAAPPWRPRNPFDETTLWDNTVDPLESYHVHGLAVLPDDTILVATEGRHEVCDAGPRDLVMRRSNDGGDTWEPTQTLVASVDGQSWGNPTFVVDRVTGGIFLFYMLSILLPENTGCSGDIGDLYMISSADGGRTWSEPREMSGLFDHFPYDWALHGPGPGHGIQLDNGRLLLNCSHRRVIMGNTVEQRYYGVASIYSDDHGETWQTTAEVPVSVAYPINEARVVQRSDGTVLVNGRAAAGGNRQRIVSVSADRGLTWSPPRLDGSTGTFNAVDASLLRYTGGPGASEPSRVLFSRPDSPVRTNMTVSISYDEAHSFRYSRVINEGRSYYSELARLSDGTILLVYGCDGDNPSFPRRVVLCRFTLEWLTDGRDYLRTGPRYNERLVDLSTGAQATGGTVSTVADPVARGGNRAVFTSNQTGAHVEYTVNVPTTESYELLLRYFRVAAGGLVTVTVDGRRVPNAVLDTTADRADGYDVAQLGAVQLKAGQHKIRFTASGVGRGGGRLVSLDTLSLIDAPSQADVRGEVVVDNDELGYEVVSGVWSAATGVAGYRGGNYRSAPAGTGERVVRWRPVVPHDGDYEVQVSYTAHENRASNAPFTIVHAGGTSVVRIDQRKPGTTEPRGGSWVSLGKYRMTAGPARIELSNAANGFVIADAVRLLP
ncbi:golvesin C-terminal-like domain-containing protein [Streptosporangium sp. NBC_01469]|uniref:golvesin C-terminal-like domain-containing protein n=1 Tax=Streptosporangium sp. NBC_01469 TaxID=2903898 RepID=UPI002E2A40D2|nr:exo-alpha-sialidase [Streptosporangium sp. NBC_01469]